MLAPISDMKEQQHDCALRGKASDDTSCYRRGKAMVETC